MCDISPILLPIQWSSTKPMLLINPFNMSEFSLGTLAHVEFGVIKNSKEWTWSLCVEHECVFCCFSRVQLCNPMDCSLQGSSVHGILQARVLGGLPRPPLGDLPKPGVKPTFPASPVLAGGFFTAGLQGCPSMWGNLAFGFHSTQHSLSVNLKLFPQRWWLLAIF